MKKFYSLSGLSFLFFLMFTLLVFTSEAKKWIVNVKNYSFTPFNLTHVIAGDTIQWEWSEGNHTTTSTAIPNGAVSWDMAISQEEPISIYVPDINGTYSYHSTLDSSMNGQFVVTGGSGLITPKPLTGPTIYPNPFKDKVTIAWQKNGPVFSKLRIFDANGKVIKDVTSIKQLQGVADPCIDMQSLPHGVFFFKFTEESGKAQTFRVIHQ
ncbi:MAG: T9SS type A sorting domain-containing protein [Bacteroidales bacterium]|nr:T9SS type A sorting domain-containing protein [Bacteroidales bacterium]MDD4603439.1 T9SS type A sorting domain-containing protein [Bacteroidales bacterium]